FEEPPSSVIVDVDSGLEIADRGGTRLEIDSDRDTGVRIDLRPDALHVGFGDRGGEQTLLAGVSPEDVSEARAEHHVESEVAQCPDRMLAAGARTEVRPGDEDGRPLKRLLVQNEIRILTPGVEERILEARLRDPLEEHSRDDLVGI